MISQFGINDTDPLEEIRRDLAALESNPLLREPGRFAERAEALDRLEVDILDRLDSLPADGGSPEGPRALRLSAEGLRRAWEDLDDILFQGLRARIRAGGGRGGEMRQWMAAHAMSSSPAFQGGGLEAGPGYDTLDAFLNALLSSGDVPTETRDREPEMVFFQKTPARILLRLADAARLTEKDLFLDLGSGLGQACLLIHLLTGAAARGIEWDPAFCGFARTRAADLGLSRVEFQAVDAREGDYSRGSVFFMYTPFEGTMLRDVLGKLRSDTRGKPIRLFTYGPCSAAVSLETWLRPLGAPVADPHALAGFQSV